MLASPMGSGCHCSQQHAKLCQHHWNDPLSILILTSSLLCTNGFGTPLHQPAIMSKPFSTLAATSKALLIKALLQTHCLLFSLTVILMLTLSVSGLTRMMMILTCSQPHRLHHHVKQLFNHLDQQASKLRSLSPLWSLNILLSVKLARICSQYGPYSLAYHFPLLHVL